LNFFQRFNSDFENNPDYETVEYMIKDKRKNTMRLSETEEKNYNFIKDAGEIQTSNIHDKRSVETQLI
jgi:hypothetical protein